MIVQEAGLAVGWPLGLGQDTTGWPLGLRLRLTQEDLQWPREPHLTRSPSYTSEDSSSLDTMSTKSFFQDKSISLGTLIGLPILDYPASRQQHRRNNGRPAFPSTAASTSASARSTPHAQQPSQRTRQDGRSRTKNSPTPGHPLASSTGWNLLSVLSCARVPSDMIGAAVREWDSDQQGSGRAQVLGVEQHDSRSVIMSRSLRLNSLGSKLYDNITFEEEEEANVTPGSDQDGSHSSKEWNPLFASSSSLQVLDDDDEDHTDDKSGAIEIPETELLDDRLPAATQMMGSESASESESQVDARKGHEHQVMSDESSGCRISRHGSDRKNKAISIFVSRMVCCRSTPTRGSSF